MSRASDGRTVVLSSPGVARPGDNPFLKLVFESYGPSVRLVPFSWRRGLLGRYDVLHVHWLELLVRSDRRAARVVKRTLFALLLLRLAATGRPSVWTVHNDSPHEDEGSRTESVLLRAWTRIVSCRVFLTQAARREAGTPTASLVIPHGHYRPALTGTDADLPRGDGAPRILHFGHVRPYKGIEGLVEAFTQAWPLPEERPRLDVVGRPKDAAYGAVLEATVGAVPGVHLSLAFLPDEALEVAIRECDLVVLPYTRMNNSGAALLALSVGRPVLVPSSASMRELREEVGGDWVRLFDPPLTAGALRAAVPDRAVGEGGVPDLSVRDWGPIGAAYTSLFTSLVHAGRRPGRRR